VLEPAAFGAPVLFGPRHDKSRDAARLIAAGGGAAINGAAGGGAAINGAADLSIRLADWLGSVTARDAAGAAAKGMVQEGIGAAERSYQLVATLLPR
jgi:3-deoxy-D-manno-octulosonic-acid transferase